MEKPTAGDNELQEFKNIDLPSDLEDILPGDPSGRNVLRLQLRWPWMVRIPILDSETFFASNYTKEEILDGEMFFASNYIHEEIPSQI